MMSILMLGLISAGGGVGVATFSQDQQSGLTQTTGGAGLREAITVENTEIFVNSETELTELTISVRNTGSVEVVIGEVYLNNEIMDEFFFFERGSSGAIESSDGKLDVGDVVFIEFEFEEVDPGSIHNIKITTEGGGMVTTMASAPQ